MTRTCTPDGILHKVCQQLAAAFLTALAVLVPTMLDAAQVDEATARSIAARQLTRQDATFAEMRGQDMQLVMVRGENLDGTGLVYFRVFNAGDRGFVIVAGDDLVLPIMAYSTEAPFPTGQLRYDVQDWLHGYETQVVAAIQANGQAAPAVEAAWQAIWADGLDPRRDMDAVQPLVSTKWDQAPHVNALCPGGSVTGCVATAMAQVMKYHNHPAQGAGFHSYNAGNYGTLSANFGATTYNWGAMPNVVNSANNAVATLMYHCGVSVEMEYSPEVSGAWVISDWTTTENCSEYALKTYFGYDPGLVGRLRDNYADAQWTSMLRAELDASRPIIYAGFGSGGGHCFVLDGYDNNGLFHVNWGWGGQADGYFAISNLDPTSIGTGGGTGGFNSNQQAIFGVKPAGGGGGGGETPGTPATLALYDHVQLSASTIYYGQAFSVSTNIVNNGSSTFIGEYAAGVFDANSNFYGFVQTLTENSGLPPDYMYTNGLQFSTSGLFSMLPGSYYIAILYRPMNGEWMLVADNGNYSNLVAMQVVYPNDIELNAALNVSPGLSVAQGSSISVTSNVINDGWATFLGQYGVGLYNLDGTWAQDVGVLTENQGLPGGYTYLSPYLTFGPATVTVPPGTYLLAMQHNPNNTGWQLTGSSYFTNPIFITVTMPPMNPDQYEVNDHPGQAYTLPVNFSGSSATVATTGANIHNGSDRDFYKVVLPAGNNYAISARMHDSWNSGDGNSYTVNGIWAWSTDGNNWSDAYDDVMPGNIVVHDGGTVWFQVAPFFPGNVGTYVLRLNIQRGSDVGVDEMDALQGIVVYPNPANDRITVDLDEFGGKLLEVRMADLQGRLMNVPATDRNGTRVIMDMTGLPEGAYVLHLTTDKGVFNQKLIIAR